MLCLLNKSFSPITCTEITNILIFIYIILLCGFICTTLNKILYFLLLPFNFYLWLTWIKQHCDGCQIVLIYFHYSSYIYKLSFHCKKELFLLPKVFITYLNYCNPFIILCFHVTIGPFWHAAIILWKFHYFCKSGSILCFSCPSPRVSYFSKEFQFFVDDYI